MTDPNYIHRIIIADRSGSMRDIQPGMQSGFREFTRMQQEFLDENPGTRMTVSLWQFDDRIERVFSFAPLPQLAEWVIEPRGYTALHDAMGQAISQEGADLAALHEDQRPGIVSVLVITDGHENRSSEYTGSQVRDMVAHQRDAYGWDVTFLGADQDAALAGNELGSNSNLNFMTTNSSAGGAMAAVSSRYTRSAGPAMAAAASGAPFSWPVGYNTAEQKMAMGQQQDEKSEEKEQKK